MQTVTGSRHDRDPQWSEFLDRTVIDQQKGALVDPSMFGATVTRPKAGSTTRRVSTLGGAVAAAAVALAVPAVADAHDESFLTSLRNAGVGYANSSETVALGQSVCAMLTAPGSGFAKTAAAVADNDTGVSPDMAGMFTTLAITMYCPSMMSSIANGEWTTLVGHW